WLAALKPHLAEKGPALAKELSEAYGSPWPKDPIRVDVSVAAGDVGAYSVTEPPHRHTTITSGLSEYQGEAALEMLFHQASHSLVEPIVSEIESACKAESKPVPRDLWHALLFYTTGEIVKRHIGGSYVPYAEKNGLYERSPDWKLYRGIIGKEWPPYLAGR